MTQTQAGTASAVRTITANLVVDAIEPVLPFWVDRLGFTQVAAVPHDDRLGFVILARDGVELMYQTIHSIAADLPAVAEGLRPGSGVSLFIEVADVGAVERALDGLELVVPRRTTFYGMDEVGVREPGGSIVIFAQKAEGDG